MTVQHNMVSLRMQLRLVGFAVLAVALGGPILRPGWGQDSPRPAEAKPAAAGRDDSAKPSPPLGNGSASSRSLDKKGPSTPPVSLEALKLPNGAIVVLCEEVADTLRLLPKAVVLTPEKYQELLEQLEQLRRQSRPPDVPSACKLTGQVDGDLVRLQAEFAFFTDRPRALVALGCQRGWATDAALEDGQLPLLNFGDDGYVVQVDKPGPHRVTLHLVVPLVAKGSKGTERGFDLDLPRAAITNLEQLQLPSSVTTVRVGGRVEKTKRADPTQPSRLEGLALGAITRLDLAWKGAAPVPQKSPSLLAAEGKRITVRVDETSIATEAELLLQVLSGETTQWRIQVSPDATLEKPQIQDERLQDIVLPTRENPVLTIRLREPSAEPLPLTLQFSQPRKGPGWMPALPFTVLDAYPQRGRIEIHARPELHLQYQLHGDVSPQEVPEDQRRESNTLAIFRYWNLKAPADAAQPLVTPLSLDVQTTKGALEARVWHSLRLTDQGWRVTTRIDYTPHRTAVDRLDIYFPLDYQYDREVGVTPADLVEQEIAVDPRTRLAHLKLAQKHPRQFSITLVGLYPVQAAQREASLELPYPVQAREGVGDGTRVPEAGAPSLPAAPPLLDKGGQVTLVVPEGREVVLRQARSEAPLAGPREYTWPTERLRARADVTWRAHRPELAVDTVVEVTLTDHQASILQRLYFTQPPPAQIHLRVPPLAANVRILDGGKLEAGADNRRPGSASSWLVTLAPEARPLLAGKDHVLTLAYTLAGPELAPLPGAARPGPDPAFRRLTVPVVLVEQATRGETKVRVWTDPGLQPSLESRAWEELPTEVVPERDYLPALVLRGGLDQALVLRLTEAAPPPLAAALIERVLVRVLFTEGGLRTYRARFLLKVNARHLDVELPAPLANLNLEALLDGKRIPVQVVEDSSREGGSGKSLRLAVEPELYRKPVVLELTYQMDPNRSPNPETVRATLRPPVLRGAVLLGRARWQVELLPGWMPLYPGSGSTLEQYWGWWRGLWAPCPAKTSAELEQWLTGAESSARTEEGEPSLVCWQTALGSLPLFCFPRQAWLLLCSATLLGLGLILSFAPLARPVFWSIVLALGLAMAWAALLWPGVVPAVLYGCEPGVLVLLVVLGVQWTLQQRYRRQVVFMPGFTRLKPGSSLIRGSNNNRPREPSTVDEPPRRGSSAGSELKS